MNNLQALSIFILMTKTGLISYLLVYIVGFCFITQGVLAASTSSVTGKAKVLNTDNSYLDFTSTYSSNVTVNNTTGNFSGYAWLQDIGWCDFGTTDNPNGPVRLNLTSGVVTGKAYCINSTSYIDFTDYSANVTLSFSSGAFSGYGWSEDVGWLNFSDTGVTLGDAGPATSGLSAWTDSTHITAVAQNTSQTDGQVSFTWTDLRPLTGDYFYWEYNTDPGNTITGDESYTTDAFKNDVLLTEGTSYFHIRPRVGATGAWGTELVFKVIYDATDNLSRLGGTLISPDDQAYTANTNPTFIFKKGINPLSGIDHYELVIDDGRGGSFSFENIPSQYTASGNKSSLADTFINDKLNVLYKDWHDDNADNDYIQVFTLEDSKKLKEGSRKWMVKAVDSVGNSRKAERILNVDLTKPQVNIKKLGAIDFDPAQPDWFYSGSKPKFSLELKDPRAGEKISDDNQTKVSSGVEKLEVEIKQKNFWGDWISYILTTETITGGKTKENVESIYTPQLNLPVGNYQVNFVGIDYVGHRSDKTSFNLEITGKLTEKETQKIVEEKEQGLGRPLSEKEKQKTVEEIQVGGPAQEKESIFSKLLSSLFGMIRDGAKGVYWGSVSGVKWVANTAGKGAYIAGVNVTGAGRTIAQAVIGINLYDYMAEKTTGIGNQISYATKTSRQLLSGKTQPLTKKIEITTGFLASVWFDDQPTRIANVRVEETGQTWVIIVWETNHWATSKVAWGESYDYGRSLESDERVKLHKMKISGLESGKTYYYEVMSQNKNYVFDARHEFRTKD